MAPLPSAAACRQTWGLHHRGAHQVGDEELISNCDLMLRHFGEPPAACDSGCDVCAGGTAAVATRDVSAEGMGTDCPKVVSAAVWPCLRSL